MHFKLSRASDIYTGKKSEEIEINSLEELVSLMDQWCEKYETSNGIIIDRDVLTNELEIMIYDDYIE